ncbi:transcription intermediary factor 1-beta-like isoform X2 [Dreissena polymorpha]|uniref:transcription intermediary factor 1-beta-like isoform X2 n=1 Tax=Dreissena polymorpha TaxID=45954 RepID=UPI002264D91A|nr:transcription intermediary factor 1-beta-like isoform X2 [Dreissena polymorpha]
MAANFETSQIKGSDEVYDLCCSICEDDDIYKEGRFHCKKCSKYFCDSCVLTHNKFHKDHSVTEKDEGDNLPVNKIFDDTLELCVEHFSEKLTMFCDDHEKLLCQLCLLHYHRQCSQVVILADKIKSTGQCMDVARIAKRIEELHGRLEDAVKIGEKNMKSLQTSYENVLEEILNLRRQINETLDRLQQETIQKLEQLHSSLKISLEKDSKQCVEFMSKLKEYDINCSENISSEQSFIFYKKCLDQTASADLFLGKQIKNAYIEFQHNTDLKQYLDSCTELVNITIHEDPQRNCVDPNRVVSVKDQSQFNVRSTTDRNDCFITGICEASNGVIIIVDRNNKYVKLLDQAFNLIKQELE